MAEGRIENRRAPQSAPGKLGQLIREGEAYTMIKDVLIGKWQQGRGRSREWWGRLTDGDLDRNRQFDRFIVVMQERYGLNRERAARELLRRMAKHKANQQIRG